MHLKLPEIDKGPESCGGVNDFVELLGVLEDLRNSHALLLLQGLLIATFFLLAYLKINHLIVWVLEHEARPRRMYKHLVLKVIMDLW